MYKQVLRLMIATSILFGNGYGTLGIAQEKPPTEMGVIEKVGLADVDWTEGVIQVTGVGTAPDRGSVSQKRLTAERAAMADAYRQLAEVVQGVKVNAERQIKDYMGDSVVIKTQVNALIKGAQKTDRRFLSDGSIEIDMVLPLYGHASLSEVLQPQKNVTPPPPVELEPTEVTEPYTGLIVDCRGLGLQPAMSPALNSKAGGEIYVGNQPIDADFVVREGIVVYHKSLNDARQSARIGKNPLIVKGLAAGGNFKTDVLISEKDTRLILGLEAKARILREAKVSLVL